MSAVGQQVVVVGAGITGLSAALSAAASGCGVVVVDDERSGRASPVAAGMLAPFSEAIVGDPELASEMSSAFQQWDSWRRSADVGDELYEPVRTVFLTGSFGDRQEVQRWATVAGIPLELDGSQLIGPFEAITEPRPLLAQLVATARLRGVSFVTGRVDALEPSSRGRRLTITSPDAANLTIEADRVIMATGAMGSLEPSTVAVRPVRGSLIILRGEPRATSRVLRLIRNGRLSYVIWRRSGEIVLGATSVESSVVGAEAGEIQQLLADAVELVPELRSCHFEEVRTGLRPTATSNSVSAVPSRDGVTLHLTGHYRHGILMAPLSGAAVTNFLA